MRSSFMRMRRRCQPALFSAALALMSGCSGMSTGPAPASAPAAPAAAAAAVAPDYAAVVASADRSEADRQVDARRKQPLLLAFTGVRPGMRVLEMSAGGGYTAELLARVVGPGGIVYAQEPRDANERARARLDERMKTAAMARVVRVVRDSDDPVPAEAGPLDLVTFLFGYHDTAYSGVDRVRMNRRLFEALRPGGMLVVADHAARPGDGVGVTRTLHRIDEAVVRQELEAAGFRLVEEGAFLRNPGDPRDAAVFQSKVPVDEFALRFVKPR